jgi:hypothetical protein
LLLAATEAVDRSLPEAAEAHLAQGLLHGVQPFSRAQAAGSDSSISLPQLGSSSW